MMKLRYLRALSWVLRHRGVTVALMVSLFCYSLYLIPHLGAIFMPPLEEGYLWIRAIVPRTVSREYAASIAPRLRELIGTVPEVDRVISQLGRPDDGTDPTSFFNLEFGLRSTHGRVAKAAVLPFRPQTLEPDNQPRGHGERADGKVQGVPRDQLQLFAIHSRQRGRGSFGRQGANSVKIKGTDLNVLEELGQRVTNVLKTVPGIENVGMFHVVGQPNLLIEIDRNLCLGMA